MQDVRKSIKVPAELHRALKLHALVREETMQDALARLIAQEEETMRDELARLISQRAQITQPKK